MYSSRQLSISPDLLSGMHGFLASMQSASAPCLTTHFSNVLPSPSPLQSKHARHRRRNPDTHIPHHLFTPRHTRALRTRRTRPTGTRTRTRARRLAQRLVDHALRLCIVAIIVRLEVARQRRVPRRRRRERLEAADVGDLAGDAVARRRARDEGGERGLRGNRGAQLRGGERGG
jgi:hypothetical protein